MMTTADPRQLDRDGFLASSTPAGPFGLRRGFGGLSSAVGTPDGRVGIVTCLDTDPADGGCLLHVVWIDHDPADPVPVGPVRDDAVSAVAWGRVRPEPIRADGLLALDV